MKISKLFHWLYFTVMMLPVFLIPIFAIAVRSDNNFLPISIEYGETQEVTSITYRYASNDVSTLNDLTDGNVYYIESFSFDYNTLKSLEDEAYPDSFEISDFLIVAYQFDFSTNVPYDFSDYYYEGPFDSSYCIALFNVNYYHYSLDISVDYYIGDAMVGQYFYSPSNDDDFVLNDLVLLIEDTSSFIAVYDSLNPVGLVSLPQYTDFNFIESVTTATIGTTVTYNDTDVGSQLLYTLYNTVDKYFNYDSVFNFGDLYSWLNTNFFSGNATLGFFIFWHLLIYWLLTSIIWLLFDVLIYVPQLIHRWLDKASIS